MLTSPDSSTKAVDDPFSKFEFSACGNIVIAVSGGSDSTALLYMAAEYFGSVGEAGRLTAVTVDHGLRTGSDEEARAVAALCTSIGIRHRTMRWEGEKPAAGVQNAARAARYRLLAEAATDTKAGVVLTGHTRDDQIETIAMRRARGEGRGLSGIAEATLYDKRIWFVRPFLERGREELREWLRMRGQGWIDDPSNHDKRFERVRRRGDLAGADPADLLKCAKLAKGDREQEAAAAAGLIANNELWGFDADLGTADLDMGFLIEGDGFGLALSAVLAWVGRSDYLPAATLSEQAARFCREARSGERFTVSGCLLTKAGGKVSIAREARNRRSGGFAFDALVPLPDHPLAMALAMRTASPTGPRPPFAANGR